MRRPSLLSVLVVAVYVAAAAGARDAVVVTGAVTLLVAATEILRALTSRTEP